MICLYESLYMYQCGRLSPVRTLIYLPFCHIHLSVQSVLSCPDVSNGVAGDSTHKLAACQLLVT